MVQKGRNNVVIYDDSKEVVVLTWEADGAEMKQTYPLWAAGRRPANVEEALKLWSDVSHLVEAVSFELARVEQLV